MVQHNITLKEMWEVADQLGYVVKQQMELREAATAQGIPLEDLGLEAESNPETLKKRDDYVTRLMEKFGDKLTPASRFTIIEDRKNENDRYYRIKEYRLFIGEYATFVVEVGVTEDRLDTNPKDPKRVYQIIDDTPFRTVADARALKETLKQYVQNTLENK